MAVRRESVRLDVEGNFARGILEDAAAVDVLRHQLKNLSGQSVQSSRATKDLERDIDKTGQAARKSSKDLDTYTGRLGLLASAIGALSPAAVPLGAVGIGGIAGIANDAGAATLAVGSLVVAMHGVAPAIKAVNKAALEPTAANLQAARIAMQELSPAARSFVREFQGIEPILHQIQGAAASGWFPGLTRALHELTPLAPVIEKIFHDIGKAGGDLIAQGAQSLAGPKWHDFFQFIDTQMPKALTALGHVLGSMAHGLAGLWMAFQPLNNSFNDWLVKSAHSFDQWATGLSKTQGFHDFLDYLHQNGPKVGAAFEAIAKAVLAIVQAAAPLGGPTLDAITALANAIATIANSDLGTPIMAMIQMASVASLAARAVAGLRGSLLLAGEAGIAGSAAGRRGGGAGGGFIGAGRLGLYGLAAYTLGQVGPGIAHKLTGSPDVNPSTVMTDPKMLQTLAGNLSFVNNGINNNKLAEGLQTLSHGFGLLGSTPMQESTDAINGVDQALADMVKSGNATKAAAEMDKIIAAGQAQGVSAEQTRSAMNDYAAAVSDAGGADAIAAQGARKHAQAIAANRVALAGAFDAETNWRAALVAADKQAKSNSAGIKGHSAAVLANRAALAQLRDAWNSQSAAVQGSLVKQAQARDSFIKTAVAMGVPIKKAEDLARQLLNIPTHINPIINILAHTQGIDEVLHKMQMLHDKTVNVWTYQYTIHKPSPGSNANGSHGFHVDPSTGQAVPNGSADGGTVPKTGRPYADRHPYLLADGEEVISNRNGQADRHRALLKAINAGRMANGGTAGRSNYIAPAAIDYDRLGQAVAKHMPRNLNVTGRMDVHQDHGTIRAVARDEIGQQSAFDERYGG